MRSLLSFGVLIVALTAARGAVADPSPGPSPAPSPALVVHITGYAYVPAAPAVHAGDTVAFVNDDDVPHTVTADDASFDSGHLAKGERWSHTFTKRGTYTYICAYHTFMHGQITVTSP